MRTANSSTASTIRRELWTTSATRRFLRHVAGRYYWMAEEFPQAGISLRSASDQNFLIVDITDPKSTASSANGPLHRADAVPPVRHLHARGQAVSGGEARLLTTRRAMCAAWMSGYYTDADSPPAWCRPDEFDRVPTGSLDALARRGAGQLHRHAVQEDPLRYP